jgi:hypothetical protein
VPSVGLEMDKYEVPENNSAITEICAVLIPPTTLAEGITLNTTLIFVDGTAHGMPSPHRD